MQNLIIKVIKKYIWCIIGVFILTILSTYIQMVLMINQMDDILNLGVYTGNTSQIYHSAFIMLILTVAAILSMVGSALLTAQASGNLIGRTREAIYRKIMSLNIEELDNFGPPTLLTRTSVDPVAITSTFQYAIRQLSVVPVALVMILYQICKISRTVFVIVLVAVVLSILVMVLLNSRTYKYFRNVQNAIDGFNRIIAEKISGTRTIRAFNNEELEMKKGEDIDEEIMLNRISAEKPLKFMVPASMMIFNWASIFVLLVGSVEVRNGLCAAADLIIISEYLFFCVMVLSYIPAFAGMLPKTSVAIERVNEIIDFKAASENNSAEDNSVDFRGNSIEFRNVFFGYENAKPIINNISFSVEKGQKMGIVGGTGSGKTTLLNLIAGLYGRYDGEILLDGVYVEKMNNSNIMRRISYLLQKNFVMQDTIRHNIDLYQDNISDEKIMEGCDRALFTEVVESKSDGLDEPVAQKGMNLSGGQRRRMMLARAMAQDYEVLLLDEPYSALDASTEITVHRNIYNSSSDKLVIIATSKVSSVKDCDLILVLDDGKAAGLGTHDELMEFCEVYREMYSMQNCAEEEVR